MNTRLANNAIQRLTQALLCVDNIGEALAQVAKADRAAPQQRESDIADLAFIAKLGKDSH